MRPHDGQNHLWKFALCGSEESICSWTISETPFSEMQDTSEVRHFLRRGGRSKKAVFETYPLIAIVCEANPAPVS